MSEPKVPHEIAVQAKAVDKEAAALALREKMDAPTRAAAAVALRVKGTSWSDIARMLDYSSPQRARNSVEAALAEMADSEEDRDQLRLLMSRRLDRILYSLFDRATNPRDPDHIVYAKTALAVIDRQGKLHGLDAPTTVVLHTPNQKEVDEYVAHVTALMRSASVSPEADIVDAEIIEEV